jgi:hypothetical protein
MHSSGLQIVTCPKCLAPAEITDRFVLESTDGPVEHITVSCVQRHRFTLPTGHLASAPRSTEPGRLAPVSH